MALYNHLIHYDLKQSHIKIITLSNSFYLKELRYIIEFTK